MSGRKQSRVALDAERQRRVDLIKEISTAVREIGGIQQQMGLTLKGLSPRIAAQFSSEVSQIRQWIERASSGSSQWQQLSSGMGHPVSVLSTSLREARSIATDGRGLQARLQWAVTEGFAQLKKQRHAEIVDLEELFHGARELLRIWHGQEDEHRTEREMERLRAMLEKDCLREIEEPCRILVSALSEKLHQAEQQEAKHQKRLYILDALRHVCQKEMAWDAEPAYYERAEDRSSRIVLLVDTLTQGVMTFYLSLEGIQSNSCLSRDHCHQEFEQLSTYLSEQFGLLTEFQTTDNEPQPPTLVDDELSEPAVGNQAMTA